jgi:hypothetical protein
VSPCEHSAPRGADRGGSGGWGPATRRARLSPCGPWALALFLAAWSLSFGPAFPGEADLLYTLDIPASRAVTYRIDLEVERAGKLVVEAEWACSRILSLRLDGPLPGATPIRRSGPSPLRIDPNVGEEAIGAWDLTVHSLGTRDGCEGSLAITLPRPPEPETPIETAPAIEPEDWELPHAAPAGAPVSWVRLFEAVERLRSIVVVEPGTTRPDSCQWQRDLLVFVSDRRDALVAGNESTSPQTRDMLLQTADAIRAIEGLRTSDDPVLVGPAPEGAVERRHWSRRRQERIRALEGRLDDLMQSLRRAYAPELTEQTWPLRLSGCLAACERHFDERQVRGESQAINRDLALQQWRPMLAAEHALRALALANPW